MTRTGNLEAGPRQWRALPSLIIAYTINMTSHDLRKGRSNLRKHGIALRGCAAAFDGPMITYEDDGDHGEQRLISIGWAHARVVVLVWTDRAEGPRLISCREANRRECQNYFKAFPPH